MPLPHISACEPSALRWSMNHSHGVSASPSTAAASGTCTRADDAQHAVAAEAARAGRTAAAPGPRRAGPPARRCRRGRAARRSRSPCRARGAPGAALVGHGSIVRAAISRGDRVEQVGRGRRRTRSVAGSRRNQDRCRRTNRRVVLDGPLARLVRGERAVELGEHLRVAQRARRGRPLAQPVGGQRRRPRRRSRRAHMPVHPLRRSARRARPASRSRPTTTAGIVRPRLGQLRAERAAGQLDDLQRPHDPPSVAGQDARPRPPGRAPASRACSAPAPTSASSVLQPGPDGGVGAGEVQLVEDGAHVQARPADEQRHGAGRAQPVDLGAGAVAGTRRPTPARRTCQRSSRWCGTPPRSASSGFAVPMSMPR